MIIETALFGARSAAATTETERDRDRSEGLR